ncbi:acyltransferase 3 (plasmid) [Rahnella aquatilis HX2]|nr:acyltransferase 3 [Rahnella aquatilis HX2]
MLKQENDLQSTYWVDCAKGIGILSVIAGHVFTGLPSEIIYLFHMPLFFFIGGYLFKPRAPKVYLLSKAKKLLTPYLIFMFLFTMMTILLLAINGGVTVSIIIKIIAKSIYGGEYLTGWLGVFWFITVFFISQQILNLLVLHMERKVIAFFIFMSLCVSYILGSFVKTPLPFNVGVVFYSIAIMYIGFTARQLNKKINVIFPLLISAIGIYITVISPELMKFNMKSSDYGVPFFSLLVSLSIITLIHRLSSFRFMQNHLILFAGKESMLIMYIHQFIHLSISVLIFKSEFSVFAFTTIISLLASYSISRFMNLLYKGNKSVA